MKISKLLVTISILLLFKFNATIQAQDLNVKWSKEYIYDNTLDGFLSSFIGENSTNLYAQFQGSERSKLPKKMMIKSFDKNTMKENGSVVIYDLKKNPNLKDKFQDMEFYKAIAFEEVIYIFFIKEKDDKKELYAQSFNSSLKSNAAMKKIYEVKEGKDDDKEPVLFVFHNNAGEGKIVFGAELGAKKGESIKVECKLLKPDMTFLSSQQFKLPVELTSKSRNSLTSRYKLDEIGRLHISTSIRLTKEEKKQKMKGESLVYQLYTQVDLEEGNIKSIPIKFEEKNVHDFSYVFYPSSVKIYGLYTDLTRDKSGSDLHGIFTATITKNSENINEINFAPFSKKQLDGIFENDKNDRKDRTSIFASKNKKDSEEESLGSNYEVDVTKLVDKDNIMLFCTKSREYSVRSCDGRGNCTTNYYTDKDNVTVFKIDKSGNLIWAKNLDRKVTYPGWGIKDLKVIVKGNLAYAVYGNSFVENANGKKKKKSKELGRDNLEYATFNIDDGKFEKKQLRFNALNTPKKERKSIYAAQLEVINNKFYVNSSNLKIKPLRYLAGIPLTIVCYPIGYLYLTNPAGFKGKGHIGQIAPNK